MIQTSSVKGLFQKKPLGRRRHLMSGAVTRREFSVRYVWNGAEARLTREDSPRKREPFAPNLFQHKTLKAE